MSRVGKKPIQVPDKTQVTIKDRTVTVKGEKGTLSRNLHDDIDVSIEDAVITVTTRKETKVGRALQGLTRSLVANMCIGVSKGFERVLEIKGIGYRAEVQGKPFFSISGIRIPLHLTCRMASAPTSTRTRSSS
jgi:large subunit ribosomal protein L6